MRRLSSRFGNHAGASVFLMQLRLPHARLKAPAPEAVATAVVSGLAIAACVAVYATWKFSRLIP